MPDKVQGPHDPLETEGETEAEGGERFSELPPRIRLEDTTATQETPPKPDVIVNPEDPHRADLRYPG